MITQNPFSGPNLDGIRDDALDPREALIEAEEAAQLVEPAHAEAAQKSVLWLIGILSAWDPRTYAVRLAILLYLMGKDARSLRFVASEHKVSEQRAGVIRDEIAAQLLRKGVKCRSRENLRASR